jgi:membrane-bound metal-dependent hydrolase YbcI (DUF457 family)
MTGAGPKGWLPAQGLWLRILTNMLNTHSLLAFTFDLCPFSFFLPTSSFRFPTSAFRIPTSLFLDTFLDTE